MKLNEVYGQILSIFPNATLDEDNDGQIIIYTDNSVDAQDNLVPFVLED